jgi:hypothetical protein
MALGGGLAACGETESTELPLCTSDATKGAPVAKMAGTWTGTGTFQQTWKGKTKSVSVKLNLVFDEQGAPRTLPALGFVSPWYVYASGDGPEPSLRASLESGGAVYAACGGEADGDANKLALTPVSRCGTDSAVEWKYQARYRFADLLQYEIYDYAKPEAPEVKLSASDAFKLTAVGGKETLLVRGRAAGMAIGSGEEVLAVELSLDAQLERGQKTYDNVCELGRQVE